MAERILIVGGPGSGKTTLAAQLSERTGLPVHHLDDVARAGGGRGPQTSAAERAAAIARICDSDRWIAEGVQLGWTAALLEAADAIVWLDHVRWQRSSGRIVRRFVGQALAEARRRRGRERFLRVRDYARRLGELAVSLPETRSYRRADTARALAPFDAKLFHCRSHRDVATAIEQLTAPVRPPS